MTGPHTFGAARGISKPLDARRAAFRRTTADESASILSHAHSNTVASKSAALRPNRSPIAPPAPPIFSSPRLSEVVYTVSPMKVGVMGGLFKDFGNVMTKKLMGWTDMALFGIAPTVGIYQYAVNFKENEKMSHRY